MVRVLRYWLVVVMTIGVGLASGACSTVDGWLSGSGGTGNPAGAAASPAEKPAAATGEQSVYYTDSGDLPLFQNPGADVIARLPLHTKVLRDDVQQGYAHVRVAATGQVGWLDNGRLIWRLPETTAAPPEAPAPSPTLPASQPVAAPASPAPASPAAASPTSASPTPAPSPGAPATVQSPSIFNPY